MADDNRPVGKVITLTASADGNIWIGDSHGLIVYKDDTFTRVPIRNNAGEPLMMQGLGIAFDGNGKLWLGMDNADMGVIIYDPADQSQRFLSQQDGHLPHNRVKSFFRFPDGNILLGTRWGLALINETTFEHQHFLHDPYDPGSISQNSIREI